MKPIIPFILFVTLLLGCKSQVVPLTRTIHGNAFDLHTGSGLNHAFVSNATNGRTVITDSVGRFSITANIGDSIRFQYVGLKDSVIVVRPNLPDYWKIGLDSINTTLIDKGVYRTQHH